MISFQDRISGGLIGLLIGDALGVPYEFHEPEDLPPRSELEFEPPDGFKRAHAGVKPGTWSDDGAQALCLLASLLHCQKLEPQDLGSRLSVGTNMGIWRWTITCSMSAFKAPTQFRI